jgi:asparagine synthase (glutamine-hydrolysing)
MCGIAGLVTAETASGHARLARMTRALAHRGPDDEGVVEADRVFLGHRRLKVVDLSANGHQPMANEDASVWITYNGEVYGTEPTRRWLESRGHRFRSRSDTEVLVHLYEEHGPGLVARLNGMFAFAIHDRRRGRLLLGRDRLGVKPLFYTFVDGELAFASELGALLAGFDRTPSLRADALGQYLLQGYVSAPDTIYRGVRSLPPAHYVDVDLAALGTGRLPEPVAYWDAPFTGDDDRPPAALARRCEELLDDAVRIRMVADVPLGAFLSGGIDSSVVVSLMARASAEPVHTFTVDVADTERSERDKARAVARMYGTRHTELAVRPAGAHEYWPRLAHFGAPFNCASLLNAWLVSRAARPHATVVLSGDGGDELFGGYTRYLRLAARPRRGIGAALGRAAAWLDPDVRGRARLVERASDDFLYYLALRHPVPVDVAERLAGTSLASWVARMRATWDRHPGDRLARAMYHDLKTYLPDHVLAKVDSASMAVSLEVRVPFLDYRVVEFAGRLPSTLKVRDGIGKLVLREMARPWLPEGLAEQAKVGFDPPLSAWAFDAAEDRCLAELSSSTARFRDVLDGRLVDRWVARQRGRLRWRVPRRSALWAVYQLEQWLRMRGDRPAPAEPVGVGVRA